jgi:hypothetical protein
LKIRNINPDVSFSDFELADLFSDFADLRARIDAVITAYREEKGYCSGSANPARGQTVIVNALMQEAALHASVTSFLSGNDILAPREGFTAVFQSSYDHNVLLVGTALCSLEPKAPEYDQMEPDAFAGMLYTDLLAATRQTIKTAGAN